MYLEVYPDIIFILNFILDFILLFLLKKINRKRSNWIRMIGASAIGSLSAVLVSIYPWMNIIIRFFIMNIATSAFMLWTAFGKMKVSELLKQMITLYLITYFTGGLINSIYYYTNFRGELIHLGNSITISNISWRFILLIAISLVPVVSILLWLRRWYQSGKKETYEIELHYDDYKIQTVGLLDTGNCLYDPIFKKPVMVIERSLMKEFLPSQIYTELMEAKNCMEGNNAGMDALAASMEQMLRLRLIPYQSIGKTRGMMLGLVLDKVLIRTGKETICHEKVTAAICDNHLSTKDDYHALLHKELI